jgi:hypothetical protein
MDIVDDDYPDLLFLRTIDLTAVVVVDGSDGRSVGTRSFAINGNDAVFSKPKV